MRRRHARRCARGTHDYSGKDSHRSINRTSIFSGVPVKVADVLTCRHCRHRHVEVSPAGWQQHTWANDAAEFYNALARGDVHD